MRLVLLAAIRAYQRHLSPHEGFSCAYRSHTGRASCSALGWRAVRRHGVLGGLALIRARTRRCGVAQRRFVAQRGAARAAQRGACDVGCDLPCDGGCDLPGGRSSSSRLCEFLSCCDFSGCDWGSRKRRPDEKHDRESQVYLPPHRGQPLPGRVEPLAVPPARDRDRGASGTP